MSPRRMQAFAVAILCGPATVAAQDIVFAEDFETDLSQWTGKSGGSHSGVIVVDPLDPTNHVVTFTEAASFGDIFSLDFPVEEGRTVALRFDYLGLPVGGTSPGSHGGFVGIADDNVPTAGRWLAGTDPISGADPILIDDSTWHSYTVLFDAYDYFTPADGRILLIVEDHIPPVLDVFFDNFRVETLGPVSAEDSSWGTIKGRHRGE